jgi:hypothetical protein
MDVGGRWRNRCRPVTSAANGPVAQGGYAHPVKPQAPARYAAVATSALLFVSAALALAEGSPGPGRLAGDRVDHVVVQPIPEALRAVDPQVSRRDTPATEKRSRPGPLLLAPAAGTTVLNLLRAVSTAHPTPGDAPSFIAFRTPFTRAPPTLPAV